LGTVYSNYEQKNINWLIADCDSTSTNKAMLIENADHNTGLWDVLPTALQWAENL